MNVTEAFEHIRKTAIDKETIYTCFVTNEVRFLEGILSIRKLFLAEDNSIVKDIMDKNFISVTTVDDQELVAQLFSKYDLISMPVVDHENLLVGIVTVDDVVTVMEEEATEDFEKMAAIRPSEKAYLKTSVFELVRNRVPWLLILMFSGMIVGNILERYESVIALLPLLVSFIPMLNDTGGNAGSQSSTLVIRGMALSEIKLKDFHIVLWKEFRVSILVGLFLAVTNFIRIYFMYSRNTMLAFVVAISLFFTVIIAKTVGSLLPMLAKLCKADPALMASPIITTVVDACALLIYFYFVNILILPLK
jgi:magnesium transporter